MFFFDIGTSIVTSERSTWPWSYCLKNHCGITKQIKIRISTHVDCGSNIFSNIISIDLSIVGAQDYGSGSFADFLAN